jgi:hypothetical protein
LQGFVDGHPGPGHLAAVAEQLGQAEQRAAGGRQVVLSSRARDRFLVGVFGLCVLAALACGSGRLDQDSGVIWVFLGVERQGLLVVGDGLGHIQVHGSVPG